MVQNKKALITGITGQDGAILAKKLLDMDYQVFGTSRDSSIRNKSNLKNLGIISKMNLLSRNLSDYRSVINVLKEVRPDQIYNLGGLTSIGFSFQEPIEAIKSMSYGILKIIHSDIIYDFVLASVVKISLREMATKIFKNFDLAFEKYLLIDKSLYWLYKISRSALNPEKIYKKILWKASLNNDQIVENLCKSETK